MKIGYVYITKQEQPEVEQLMLGVRFMGTLCG